jgi:small RNA 2'-O-methyltransferase
LPSDAEGRRRDRERRNRRRAAASCWELLGRDSRGQDETKSPLHEERLDAVVRALTAAGARTIVDLGCGSGSLLRRLAAEPAFTRIVGVDTSLEALRVAEAALGDALDGDRVALRYGSFTEPEEDLRGFDAAALVETIEHVEPSQLSRLERAVFARMQPGLAVVTTPNREYNVRYGLAEGELRHVDHRFEWPRARFRSWAEGVGERNGYRISFEDIGPADPLLGSPTQMAVFLRSAEE